MSDLMTRTSMGAEPFSAMSYRQLVVANATERLFASAGVRAGLADVGEMNFDHLPEDVRDLISPDAVDHRKAGFSAGRLAAARALQRSDRMPSWPGRTKTGAPSWPQGRVGSISHTDGVAAAVVADPLIGAIGVDVEERRRAPAVARFADRFCVPEEVPDTDDEADLLRVFCAKEALYKSLPPDEQAGLGFLGLRLERAPASVGDASWVARRRLVAVREVDGLIVAGART